MTTAIHSQQTFEHIEQEIVENIKGNTTTRDSTAESIKSNRILSLSGGGVKGIAERTCKSISELFPIITGTSVGGLIAALLTIPKEPGSKEAKYSAKEALEIFKESSSDIFPNTFLGSVKQLFTHKYSQKPLC